MCKFETYIVFCFTRKMASLEEEKTEEKKCDNIANRFVHIKGFEDGKIQIEASVAVEKSQLFKAKFTNWDVLRLKDEEDVFFVPAFYTELQLVCKYMYGLVNISEIPMRLKNFLVLDYDADEKKRLWLENRTSELTKAVRDNGICIQACKKWIQPTSEDKYDIYATTSGHGDDTKFVKKNFNPENSISFNVAKFGCISTNIQDVELLVEILNSEMMTEMKKNDLSGVCEVVQILRENRDTHSLNVLFDSATVTHWQNKFNDEYSEIKNKCIAVKKLILENITSEAGPGINTLLTNSFVLPRSRSSRKSFIDMQVQVS